MKTKKLFCTDLDDTLLAADKSIPGGNIIAIRELLRAGHSFAIVTGRTINGGRLIFDRLGIDTNNCYLACFQGNVIYDLSKNEIVSSHGMDADVVIDLLRMSRKYDIYAQTYTPQKVLIPYECETSRRFLSITEEGFELIGDFDDLRGCVLPKVILVDYEHPEKLAPFREAFAPFERGRVSSFFSCPQYLEYCDKGHDKGVGLTNLARYLNIDIKDVVAIGDERNDISMLRAAGLGVAVANAHPDAKEAADVITENDNEGCGVAEAIRRFILS